LPVWLVKQKMAGRIQSLSAIDAILVCIS